MFTDNNIYNFIHARRTLKLELAVIAVAVVYFFTTYAKFNQLTNVIALFTLVAVILIIRLEWSLTEENGTNEDLMYKLNKIQSKNFDYVEDQMKRIRASKNKGLASKEIYDRMITQMTLDWLYTDSKIIRFFDSLAFLYSGNPDSYVQMVVATNSLLELRGKLEEFYNDTGKLPKGVYYIAQTAEELKLKALNYAHSFIFITGKTKIPDAEYTIEKIINELHLLLKPHVTAIKQMSIKQNVKEGINRTTKFVDTSDHLPKPTDEDPQNTLREYRFDFYV